ncbi:MAG: 16S rRNA (adenine(1518)-N(6)/adenine(1519)-N(6))-dimethyltransferase RsmA [Pyrinomonadaceae bacterium]
MPEKNGRRRKTVRPAFAKKSLGQNFLCDRKYTDRIITALDPREDETVVEIGAGRGAITKEIVKYSGKVIAIEIDRELVPLLREEFASFENFVLIEKDALEVDFSSLLALQSAANKTKLVANLPYYISTAILQHLIEHRSAFSQLVLMLQKEVVERIVAEPGNKERGYLTVLTERYFNAEKLFDVPPSAFRPSPKVTSSVVSLTPLLISADAEKGELFRDLVSTAFSQKRKTIMNNLKNADQSLIARFEKIGGIGKALINSQIDPSRRAEQLAKNEWEALLGSLFCD